MPLQKGTFDLTEFVNNNGKYTKLRDVFLNFLWNLIYNFENIFKTRSHAVGSNYY